MKKRILKKAEPFFYLLPAMAFFFLFTYYPFAKTIYSSFFRVDSMGILKEFVGLENYRNVLTNPDFLTAIKNTIIYVIMSVPLSIFIALILALIANKKTRTSSVYETLFSLTMAMSTSVCAMIFELMYNPSLGILNRILGTNIRWLTDSDWTLYSIGFISTWMNIGYNFLFLLAAVRGVPQDLLECASTEGAGTLKKAIGIILPLISPTVFFLICNSLAKSMMMSGLVLILTEGGRQGAASTMISYMYRQAVNSQNYNNGYASAIVAFCITFVFLLISFSFEKKKVFYN